MLEVIELWRMILDAGGVVDAIYFDFAKAFDTVQRERLLLKCSWDHYTDTDTLISDRNVSDGS